MSIFTITFINLDLKMSLLHQERNNLVQSFSNGLSLLCYFWMKKTCKPAKVLIDKCQWGRKVIYLRGRKHMRTFLVILFFLSIMCFRMCSLILQCPLFCKCLTDNNHFVWMVQSHTSFLKGWTSKDIFSISTASWTEYLVTTANATAHDRQGKDYYHLVLGCCCALRKVPR